MSLPKEKLKRLQIDHPDWDKDTLARFATKLTSTEGMLEEFQPVLEVGQAAISETQKDKETFGETLEYSVELEKACMRVEERMNPLANFRVVVFLKDLQGSWMNRQITRVVAKLSDLLHYGPHQVAIAIGDKVLEWNASGLVIPRSLRTEEMEETERFIARVHQQGAFYERAEAGVMEVKGAVDRKIDYSRQEEVVANMASHRERLVKQVVEVIVKYNTRYSYNTLCRGSHHFVQDILGALEITERPDFHERAKVGEQFARLKKGRSLLPEYSTHRELDEYVEGHIAELTADKGMLEYVCNMYAHFHRKEWRKSGGSENRGECHEESCKYVQLRSFVFSETIKR